MEKKPAGKCAKCGGPLEGTPPEEMHEEHDRLFPGMDRANAVIVCDDCFRVVCPGGRPVPEILFETQMDEEKKQ